MLHLIILTNNLVMLATLFLGIITKYLILLNNRLFFKVFEKIEIRLLTHIFFKILRIIFLVIYKKIIIGKKYSLK